MSTFKTKIGDTNVTVNSSLINYRLFKKPSTHVAFYGTDRAGKSLFVQYNNGSCIRYNNVSDPLLARAEVAPSIGKFLHAELKNHKYEEVAKNSIVPVQQEEGE